MKFEQIVWMLDVRFDFLLPWFEKEYNVSKKNILFIGSYHGKARRGLKTLEVGNIAKGHVLFYEPEDINKIYANKIVREKRTLVVPFSGAYLPSDPHIFSLVSTGDIAVKVNNKWWQYKFFEMIGINTPKTWWVDDSAQLVDLVQILFETNKKLLIKKAELSGGYKMKIVDSLKEVYEYCSAQEDKFLYGGFLISEYIVHEQSFAGTGIIREDGKVIWYGVTEQVLYNGLAYEGLIYPPYITESNINIIKDWTCTVGKYLAQLGYHGYFNVDFILREGSVYAVEINARFGFGTIFFACCGGENFWKIVRGEEKIECKLKKRLILGKIKGKEGKRYSDLISQSDIITWFQNGNGEFKTYYCATDETEIFDYGSFIGMFGAFLPIDSKRDDVLHLFWERCLCQY